MELTQLPTPAIVIDAAVVRRNIARMADYARRHGLALRPHTKTHKSIIVGGMQVEAGAIGLTAAKVGEAVVMSEATDDLLMAYPAVDPLRCARLAQLAIGRTVRVAVDSVQAVECLGNAARAAGSTIGVLVDLDVGLHRTGAQSPQAALALAQRASWELGVRLDGLFFYPGHVKDELPASLAQLGQVEALVAETLALWSKAGLEARIVSGGSTPTAYISHHVKDQTEIRPGTYVYYDMNGIRGGYATLADSAARIHATVVSTAVPGQVVIDAGSKTLTMDRCGPAPDSGHGLIIEYPQAKIARLTEEHGQVDVGAGPAPRLGERVTIVPNHICPCVNLQSQVWWMDAGDLHPVVVDARGKVF